MPLKKNSPKNREDMENTRASAPLSVVFLLFMYMAPIITKIPNTKPIPGKYSVANINS
jgi:hypothetical protein